MYVSVNIVLYGIIVYYMYVHVCVPVNHCTVWFIVYICTYMYVSVKANLGIGVRHVSVCRWYIYT